MLDKKKDNFTDIVEELDKEPFDSQSQADSKPSEDEQKVRDDDDRIINLNIDNSDKK
jgi:hypothetical protein